MDLGDLASKGVTFPGAAGQLQRAGNTAALATELGRNYEQYHANLAQRLDQVKASLDRASLDLQTWLQLAATELAVYSAEVLCRMCRALVLDGRPLSDGPLLDGPIVAASGRLAAGASATPAAPAG